MYFHGHQAPNIESRVRDETLPRVSVSPEERETCYQEHYKREGVDVE